MARALYNAVIKALKKAHTAYLAREYERFVDCVRIAESAMSAIRSLGSETERSRDMILLLLNAETLLLCSLTQLNTLEKAVESCVIADSQMLLTRSLVIGSDAPMIPHCEDTLAFFGGADEPTAEQVSRITGLYARMTDGGGGGIAEIYRAQLAAFNGQTKEAIGWARLALGRMRGDVWIAPIAHRLIGDSDEEDHCLDLELLECAIVI